MPTERRRHGVVAAFDVAAGHGRVRDDDGGEWFFHAVAIADGSRTIDVGAAVEFEIVPGLAGRWEAASVRARLGSGVARA